MADQGVMMRTKPKTRIASVKNKQIWHDAFRQRLFLEGARCLTTFTEVQRSWPPQRNPSREAAPRHRRAQSTVKATPRAAARGRALRAKGAGAAAAIPGARAAAARARVE